MARFSPNALPVLAYILVMVAGGVAAKSWHGVRAERAVYTPAFRVPSPPAGTAPGENVDVHYETYRLGNHEVCEIGNVRLAIRNNRRYYGGASGSFGSPTGGDPKYESRSTNTMTFADLPINVVNCHVEIGGGRYPVTGPKRLLIIDAQGNVLNDVALAEPGSPPEAE